MFLIGDRVRIGTGAYAGDNGTVVGKTTVNGNFEYLVRPEGVLAYIFYPEESLDLVEDADATCYLTGQVTFDNELVNCAVEFSEDANLGNVIVIHLPKNRDISNATNCVYFKYDLED